MCVTLAAGRICSRATRFLWCLLCSDHDVLAHATIPQVCGDPDEHATFRHMRTNVPGGGTAQLDHSADGV